jgi:hypothetical protein
MQPLVPVHFQYRVARRRASFAAGFGLAGTRLRHLHWPCCQVCSSPLNLRDELRSPAGPAVRSYPDPGGSLVWNKGI